MPSFSRILKRLVLSILAAGIVGLSWYALQNFAPQDDRYQLPFAEIDSPSPPDYVPRSWLQEVQSQARLPDVLDTRTPDLPGRLQQAFAGYPWVDNVELVAIRSHRRIECRLSFRTPVAVVPLQSEIFLVDGKGLVLPRGPQTAALESALLPIRGAASPPRRGNGQPWGHAGIETAARIAAVVRNEREVWQLNSIDLDADPLRSDVRLRTRKGTVIIWETIESEKKSETVSTAEKIRRLREYSARYGGLDGPSGPYELDLRPSDGILRRAIAP